MKGWGLFKPSYMRHIIRPNPAIRMTAANFATKNQTDASLSQEKDSRQSRQKKFEYPEEYRKKMGNYYSMLLASAVGVIGSSYLLFQRFSKVEAKELEGDEKNHVDLHTKSDTTLHKSQAGFRERKVLYNSQTFFR